MHRTATRGWASLVPLVLAATALAGCGSSQGAAGKPTRIPAGAALVAAAREEGGLTFYSTFSDKELAALTEAFGAAYPGIKVNVLQGSVNELAARIVTEQRAGSVNADLFQGDASYADGLITLGALQPYSPVDEPAPPQGLGLPEGYANVDSVLTSVIAYNPEALRERGLSVPTSLQDLTAPRWKGQFSADASGVNWYESLIRSTGHQRAKQLVTRLGANAPRLSESHTLSLTQVQSGEPAATVAAYGYSASAFARQTPATVATVNPDPLPSAPDLVDLVSGAPHPDAAALFMSWLLSRKGQQELISVSDRISLRTDVTNVPTAWNPARWKPVWSTPAVSADRFNAYSSELESAFHAK